MSFNHDNVLWQSKDGSWNRGFFSVERVDGDEWDAIYDFSTFEWASTGHLTEDSANDSWRGVNPGMVEVVPFSKRSAEEIANYDRMAAWCKDPELKVAYDKAQAAKLNRVRRAALVEQCKTFYPGVRVRVRIKRTKNVGEFTGAYSSVEGFITKVGDWLVVDGQNVFNVRTNRMNLYISEVREVRNYRW